MEHKYKVGDEVLIRVKVMELLNTKANGYMMTSGDFDHWVIQEQNIHGLAPATAPAIPEGWTAASVPPKKLPAGGGMVKVEIMLKNGETAFGWQSYFSDSWNKLAGGFREEMRNPYYTPNDAVKVDSDNPVIAWRELPPKAEPTAKGIPEGWTPASQPPEFISCKMRSNRDVQVLFSNGKERRGYNLSGWMFYRKSDGLATDAPEGKIIAWKELDGALAADLAR